jgi:hypothetical protein
VSSSATIIENPAIISGFIKDEERTQTNILIWRPRNNGYVYQTRNENTMDKLKNELAQKET